MRARLALSYANIPFEIREVVLRDKPAELIALSPKATVPVLQLPDGRVLDESLDIMIWALEQNDPEHWQLNDDAHWVLIQQNDTIFKHHLDRYKYPNRYCEGTAAEQANVQASAQKQAYLIVKELNARLEQHDFLAGEHATMLDIAIAPFVRQLAGVNTEYWQQQPLPNIQRWLTWFTGFNVFQRMMEKYPPWHGGDTPIIVKN